MNMRQAKEFENDRAVTLPKPYARRQPNFYNMKESVAKSRPIAVNIISDSADNDRPVGDLQHSLILWQYSRLPAPGTPTNP